MNTQYFILNGKPGSAEGGLNYEEAEHEERYRLFRGEKPFFEEGKPCTKEKEG